MLFFCGVFSSISVTESYMITNDLFNRHAFCSYVIIFLLFIYFWLKRTNRKKRKVILLTSLAGYFFTQIYSIFKLLIDPDLSRKAAAAIVTDNSADSLNAIGGFDTVYGSIILLAIMICLCGSINHYQSKVKICILVCIITTSVFIVFSSFGIALVMMVILFILVLIEKNKKISSVICVFSLILCLIFHKQIGLVFIGLSLSISPQFNTLSGKVFQIGNMFITGESTGTLAGNDGRLARMMWSWEAFLAHPLFGSIRYPEIKIGSHSEILDIPARFGIFALISILVFFVLLYKETIHLQKTTRFKKFTSICYILYVVIAILNPAIFTQQVLPFLIILPFIEEFCIYKGDT